METNDILIFFESPMVTMATNTFINVPTILQYEDTPLVSVIKEQITKRERTGFSIEIPIYHPDGTYLAKAVGSRLFKTKEGKKAGLTMKHPQNMVVCELDGKTLFEIHRDATAAISASAELYTPTGAFVKCPSNLAPQLFFKDNEIKVGSLVMRGNTFSGVRIGILLREDGSIGIGVT